MKKIFSIFIVSLLLMLVAATLLTALIKTSLPNPIKSSYETLQVWKDGTMVMEAYTTSPENSDHKKHFDEISKLHKDSLKDSVLSTLFQNNAYSYGTKVEHLGGTQVDTLIKNEGIWLVFIYSTAGDDSEILELDGKKYVDKDKAETQDRNVYYKKLIMQVNDTVGFEDVNLYLENSNKTVEAGGLSSYYAVKFLAKQESLFEYINLNLI